MENADGRKVKGVTNHGSILHGEAVRFDLMLDDGTVVPYHADYSNMSLIVSTLQNAAQLAETARRTRGVPNSEDLMAAYLATGCRTGVFSDTSVAVQITTAIGVPLVIRIPQDLCKKLVQDLQKSLTEVSGEPGKRH